MEDMYRILGRIADIKKRFGLMRHNNTGSTMKTDDPGDYKSIQHEVMSGSGSKKSYGKGTVGEPRNIENINKLAEFYSKKNNVPSSLVKAIIETESGYDPDAVSGKGAKGLMQLMPSVIREMGVVDPFIPAENIRGGVEHLKDLLTRYNGDYKKALAAYNAGMKSVDRSQGIPEYKETKEYVNKVISSYLKNR